MNQKSFLNRLNILLIFFVSFIFLGGAVSYVQDASFNNNGTGIISLTYSAKTSEVKSSNNLIGNLPFSQDKINEYFNSANTKVTKAIVYKNKTDTTITSVAVEINVSNLNKLKDAKAFTGVEAGWIKSDTGMVFSWLFTPAHAKTNSILLYQIGVKFEGEIKSTTGVLKDNQANWYVLASKMNPGGAYFLATIKSDGTTKNPFGTSKESGDKKTTTETKTEENKPSGCGLFGLELPIIISLGFAFSKFAKRRKE
ncbi:MAG: hypothetical protein IPJ45_06265 [Ignavibacteria bacterium]|nr:hypothetical protein [Ignavibacteria bacterium]